MSRALPNDPEALRLVAKIANDPLMVYATFKAGKGGMSPGQRRAHMAQGVNRIVMAGNQVGKTRLICAEIWWQGLGWHPYRPITRTHGKAWCVIKDFESGYPEFCAKMHEVEPPNVLHPSCTWSEASGYSFIEKGKRHTWLVFKDGYQVQFKSGTQDAKSLESGTVDAIFFDEPPKPGHWAAGRMRVSVGNGPTLIGFTAVNAPLGWLKKEVEGDPESGMAPAEVWEKIIIVLSMKDSPHRTPEDIEAQKKKAAAQGQTEQRINGGWEGLTIGRRFQAFGDRHIKSLRWMLDTYKIDQFRIGADWGEGGGKTAIYVEGIVGTKAPYTYLVLGEYVSKETTTPAMDAAEFVKLLKAIGIPATAIRRARGDVNSAGKLGMGQSCNTAFELAVAKELGVRVCPFKFEVPNKTKGSVEFGHGEISHAQMEDRFFVSEDCKSLIQSFYHFVDEEALKHALDGCRYGLDDTFGPKKNHSFTAAAMNALNA